MNCLFRLALASISLLTSTALADDDLVEPAKPHERKPFPGEKRVPGTNLLFRTEPSSDKPTREEFQMPFNELLSNCYYTATFSYPDFCTDSNGNVIFNSEKDKQAVLDRIIEKQGKGGKYNKMPNGGPVKYNNIVTVQEGKE